jgi:hypothetical protein
MTRRASLSVEGLESRTVLSTATLTGSTLQVVADPGTVTFVTNHGIPFPVRHIRPITFKEDAAQPAKVDVFDSGTLLGRFTRASIKNVQISVAGLDAVTIDDSNSLPFAAGTNVSLFGSSSLFGGNSLNLLGSRTIAGGETYAAGNGAQAGSLSLGGVSYLFTNAIGSVTDLVTTTAPLFVRSAGQLSQAVTLNGSDGVTQTLSGLAAGNGGGSTLTYGNKIMVELDLFTTDDVVNLNATAAAAGEKFFVVVQHTPNQSAIISATPATVTTDIVAAPNSDVVVAANLGRVTIEGTSSTLVQLAQALPNTGLVTSGIKNDVFVSGVGSLIVNDGGNRSTQEHVTVTESTVSGTGLFGNSAVKLHYSSTANLTIVTGHLANIYSVVGSHPGARFGSNITIDDLSDVGMSVVVALDAGSGLQRLNLLNTFEAHPAAASLFISAPGAFFSHPVPTLPAGIEDVFFLGGLSSEVVYNGFTNVTHS